MAETGCTAYRYNQELLKKGSGEVQKRQIIIQGAVMNYSELVAYMVKSLVDHPEQVEIKN